MSRRGVTLTFEGGRRVKAAPASLRGGGRVSIVVQHGATTVSTGGATFEVDGAPCAVEVDFGEGPPASKKRRRHVEPDPDSDDSDAGEFRVRIGDVALVELESEPTNGLLLVTEVPEAGAEGRAKAVVHGYWLYRREELPRALQVNAEAEFSFSTHHDEPLYASVTETCRPLDWVADTNTPQGRVRCSPKVSRLLYDAGARRFIPGVQSACVLGWAAAASKNRKEVRAAILNQVGPLLGGKYGQIIDELALCGPAGSSKSAIIKREIIQNRAAVATDAAEPGTEPGTEPGPCWACGLERRLSATVGDTWRVGRCCAQKLSRLSALTGVLEDFLAAPWDPDTVMQFIEDANAALA